ncbi:putative denn domain-containing protein [Golovinomyces cichoracearum]|uniref:Putative denn domain-containing protein n=1 Tax=Golovinomyces cichoracearum TaxID=62708 RepID=A0A420HG97_9PEZI|nr:putative denn domain-containing protein [Golovinomyces cichoracearum]
MASLLKHNSSFTRPSTRDCSSSPVNRDQNDSNLVIPGRTSSLHSRITQPIPTAISSKPLQRAPKTLTHAYMVCGIGREPTQWVKAPAPAQGKIGHMKGAVSQFWAPEILGSSPRLEQDQDIARSLHWAMRACFPHDIEVCTGRNQPHCVHHSFVLQQDSSQTLYGIALRVWSKADEKRGETIRDIRRRLEPDFYDSPDETYWIPYCLSFLSRYPLYNLLGDYIRGMWIHWNKATNLFHAEEVSRILSFPAPRLNDLVRIDMKDYALCYQFPASPTGFQNFAMWPLFSCLSIPNIVGVIEAAISPARRIIFISHYPAILTLAAETIRFCVRIYEWSGLYVPVVHARNVNEVVQEPGPYILGITAECRSLFTAPPDVLVVDLDRNFVLTSSPPTALTTGQRNKMISRLAQALNGEVIPSGVPQHLRSAYGGGKLVPAGQIIVLRGEVESVQDPEWWNQESVMAVMDHVCEKIVRLDKFTKKYQNSNQGYQGKNSGIKAIFDGKIKKPNMTKVSLRQFNEIVRERNQYSRDASEAWQDYISLKGRMDTEIVKVNKRNNFLVEELDSWKQQFLKFQSFVEKLTVETQDLNSKIENLKRENKRLTGLIDQLKEESARLSSRLPGTEKQRDDALEALVLQQEIAEELERERKKNKKEIATLQHNENLIIRQRDEAQRVVLHLRAMIDGQTHHMEHIVRTLGKSPELAESIENNYYGKYEFDEKDLNIESDNSKAIAVQDSSLPCPRRSRRDNAISPRNTKRFSQNTIIDVADRHLKEKTDAIAHIIRNISEQCAAAVEGLQLAHETDREVRSQHLLSKARGSESSTLSIVSSDMLSSQDSETGDENSSGHRASSSIPPTPELTNNRSSTSMSIASTITTPERVSLNYNFHTTEIPTKIVEDSDEEISGHSEGDTTLSEVNTKVNLIHRPTGARLSALGGQKLL